MTDIDEILASLNPKTREKVIKARDVVNTKQALPSIGLTRTLGGGIGYGRQSLIWGNRSAGKTMFCLLMVAMAQREGRSAAWVDAERNFDPDWAERLGVDVDNLALTQIGSIADMVDVSVQMVKRGTDILVVDSISPLLPQSYFDDEELKAFEKTQQIGTFSKNIGAACNMINSVNTKGTAVVLVSQIRNEFGSMHATMKPMGGKGLDHMNSTSIKLWSTTAENYQIKGQISEGDYIYEAPVAREVNWFVDKSRGPGMGQRGDYHLYYDGDFVGIDQYKEVLDIGVKLGKVTKGGAWYNIYGEQFQGGTKASAYLRENPEVFEKLKGEVLG